MATPRPQMGRTESLQISTTAPQSSDQASPAPFAAQQLDPLRIMMEHMVAQMARFEARLEAQDTKSTATPQTTRPPPAPPYGSVGLQSQGQPQPGLQALQSTPVSVATTAFQGAAMGNPNGVFPYSTPVLSAAATPFIPPTEQFQQQQSQMYPYTSLPTAMIPMETHNPNPTGPPWVHPTPSPSWNPPGGRLAMTQCHPPQPQRQPSSWDHPATRQHQQSLGDPQRFIKMEAPRFNGSDASTWVSRVQYYFDHILMPDEHRLHYVVMLFDPPAAEWIFNYRSTKVSVQWQEFLEDVRRRFDPLYFQNFTGLIAKLCQTGTLADYNTAFEGMMSRAYGLSETALIPIYIEGLQQPVKSQVRHKYPDSLAAAVALAIEFDSCVERQPPTNFSRRPWQPRDQRSTAAPVAAINHSGHGGTKPPLLKNSEYARLPVIRLSKAEKAERTRKGLCWYCPEKYGPDHVCSKSFLVYMGVDDDSDEEVDEPPGVTEEGETTGADLSHLYALEGRQRVDAIELIGTIGAISVRILVDTGSTHNFLHPDITEKLELPLRAIKPFKVYVGNGASLTCAYTTIQTRVVVQKNVFLLDLHVLPVHGPDMVLGIKWLKSLRRVTSDYEDGTIEFVRNGKLIRLHLAPPLPRRVSLKTFASLMSLQGAGEVFELLQLQPSLSATESDGTPEFPTDVPPSILRILEQHHPVFSVPQGMPPARLFDHRIHLQPNTNPVNVRPYRYPYFQKSEIEKQVKEMLDTGIIRPSQSPFSSPVLLIRKKDGSFRFCIDYRALNTVTVPDHFPIPTSDELFDELGKARVFTKLDLRSGYHQIRMHSADIYKTAFRTHDGHFEFLVMPFGLTNAPSTFQAAMNAIFRPLLRRFVIVFFDDILIYSPCLESHAAHLHEVLSILEKHKFFVKLSKCSFCSTTVEYLGHLISDGLLKADPGKIEAMVAWPVPTTIKHLRGFLGLTGYYRRFVAGYAMIAGPLTELLKKDAFAWSPAAEKSFEALKVAMTTAPVLRLPDFDRPFYIETDASDFGVGAVLLQDNHPLAFFSKKLGPRRRITSTYHKELYAIVEAVQKWRQYLLGREFVIRSDQKSLKELLQQVIQTPDQQLYARKLMGYKFRIEYKTGASNKVADALSRRDLEVVIDSVPEASIAEPEMTVEQQPDDLGADSEATAASLLSICHPVPDIMELLRSESEEKPDLVAIRGEIRAGTAPPAFLIRDGLVYFQHRIFVSEASEAKNALLFEHHSTPSAGHPGVERTFRRLAASFYWKNMRKEVKAFVEACYDCQTTKYSTQRPAGLLQPLPIPSQVWEDVSMDFITGLPQSRGFTTIMVVVDRLSKYAHFAPLPTSFNALKVANLFIDTVVKHHGFPTTLVSDRDPVFVNDVWEDMLRLSGTKLNFTTAYHPQSDGQTEVRNRGLEQYLRAFTAERPKRWANFLPWAELALNCFHHEGLGMAPFKALYGREPPPLIASRPSLTTPPDVAVVIRQRGELLVELRKNLERAQQRMRDAANKHRRDVEFEVGERVLLKLQLYRQHSVARPLSTKLSRRYYGPFEILERIGPVAYRLQLPAGSRVHNVFHVSLLREFISDTDFKQLALPPVFARGRPVARPVKLVDRRSVWCDGAAVDEGLVQWSDDGGEVPTWEPMTLLARRFPYLLEDKERLNGEGVDTGITAPSPQKATREEELELEPSFDTVETETPARASTEREARPPKRSRRPPARLADYVER